MIELNYRLSELLVWKQRITHSSGSSTYQRHCSSANKAGCWHDGTYLTSGIFLGGHYSLTNNIGAFVEPGYDISYLTVSLSARF